METVKSTTIILLVMTLGVMLLGLAIGAPEAEEKKTMEDFFYAISAVESNHDDYAVGSNTELGRYQITEDYFLDGVEYGNIYALHTDCVDPKISQKIMLAYFERYAPEYLATEDWVALARIHHGGWNGMNRAHTLPYAHRVRNIMEDM